MRTDKLQNLLVMLEKRIDRSEKSLKRLSDHELNHVPQALFKLRSSVKRHMSKPDMIRIPDVDALEDDIESLRAAADLDLDWLRTGSPVTGELRTILGDEIGLKNLTAGMRIGLIQLRPDDVLDATPGQKPAAYQFDIVDDVLVVVDQPLHPSRNEVEIALAALDAAIDHGAYVNADLTRTNVSPRLRDAFSRLQETMASHKNIVQVGSCALICNRLINAEADELSANHHGLLVAHVETVFAALAQFEDWRIFSENAVAANLDPASALRLAETTRLLVNDIGPLSSVDRTVPEALTTVAGWVADQENPDRRDVLSLTRTLENIWSIVVREALALGRETVTKARSAVAASVVGALLLTAAATVPILGKIPGAHWIENAYSYLKAGQGKSLDAPTDANNSE